MTHYWRFSLVIAMTFMFDVKYHITYSQCIVSVSINVTITTVLKAETMLSCIPITEHTIVVHLPKYLPWYGGRYVFPTQPNLMPSFTVSLHSFIELDHFQQRQCIRYMHSNFLPSGVLFYYL